MTSVVGATAVVLLCPIPAAACAVCLTSPYGDRSFNWAFVVLMLMPFAVAAALAGVLAWQFGVRRVALPTRRATGSPDGTGEGSRAERPASP